jgi:hypothetical protein
MDVLGFCVSTGEQCTALDYQTPSDVAPAFDTGAAA